MGFHYQKNKGFEESGSQWTSMSDLFLGLSVIFLLLYVAGSLKQGTSGVQQAQENQRLTQESEDLKRRIKVYDTLKQQYLEEGATEDEQQLYKELMGKLTLLQEGAKEEKEDLRRQATENEKKEMALNKYQKMIRDIVNANMIAQARIKKRDNIIDKKDDEIEQKTVEIEDLEKTVAEKKTALVKGEKKIAGLNSQLNAKINELQEAFQNQEMTKKNFEAQKEKLRKETAARVAKLRKQNEQTQEQLNEYNEQISGLSSKLSSTEKNLEKVAQEKERLGQELSAAERKAADQAQALREEFEAQRGKDRAAFEAALGRERLSGAEKLKREAAFRAEADRKQGELNQKIAALQGKVKDTQGQLAKAQEVANARKALANRIKESFGKNGIKADVDGSGDVLLSFGDQYFDTGRSDLKPEMKKIVEAAVPVYSDSLFEDAKIADRIASVEIVGFASPTYKNKVVDPASLDPDDRQAVDYNLDLSYARARAIFQHIFDKKKMTFKHQQQLLPLVKVTGRSFLAEAKNDRSVASGKSSKSFCEQNDCAKAQRVIIKFTLKD